MPRKGSTKSRTGCYTCKARKVKCDEGKPGCLRCASARRPCSYPPPPVGQAAVFYGMDQTEVRALDFFREQVAPVLSMHSNKDFWRDFVCQVAHEQPAVRHSLVCISSLYEGLDDTVPGSMSVSREKVALTQYNKALSLLVAPQADNNIVLFVCLLFVTIEAMRSNKLVALQHCRHGINLWNDLPAGTASWAKNLLRPFFLRLATLPYYFSVEAGDFPEPILTASDLQDEEADWEAKWEGLVLRTVLIIRKGLAYIFQTVRSGPVPESLLEEQRQILDELTVYTQRYRAHRQAASPEAEDYGDTLWREMHCMVGKIWVSCCMTPSELVYDEFDDDFAHVLQLSQLFLDYSHEAVSGPKPKFIFEMGFMPLLYFVARACRRLDLRLTALQHMLQLSHEREALFQTKFMYSAVLRCVELEHNIALDPAWPEYPNAAAVPRPPGDIRI
ncbi:hypothetical protein BD289DRAFT_348690, partial [Coniella lustricola]